MEPEPEALCSAFMPSVGYRWEFGIVTCGRAPWGSLPSPVLTELPAEQSAESLLFGLDGLQKDDLTWLYWMLEESLRLGYLGARELLALEGASKNLFPRKRTELLARKYVTSSGELSKPAPRLCAPELKVPADAAVPALRAEAPVQAGHSEAAYEEWRIVRARDRLSWGRLTRSGPAWDEVPAGTERWMEKAAQLQAYDRPVFTNVSPTFSTSAKGDTVTVNEYASARTALAGHGAGRMQRGVHCVSFRIKSVDSEAGMCFR